jgi:hypothetical protein
MANRYFGRWPFDNICEVDTETSASAWNMNHTGFEFCKITEANYFLFKNTPDAKELPYDRCDYYGIFCIGMEYQSKTQRFVTELFMYGFVVVVVLAAAYFFFWSSAFSVRSCVVGVNDTVGETSCRHFTTIDEIQAYVPQVLHISILYTPMLSMVTGCSSIFAHCRFDTKAWRRRCLRVTSARLTASILIGLESIKTTTFSRMLARI